MNILKKSSEASLSGSAPAVRCSRMVRHLVHCSSLKGLRLTSPHRSCLSSEPRSPNSSNSLIVVSSSAPITCFRRLKSLQVYLGRFNIFVSSFFLSSSALRRGFSCNQCTANWPANDTTAPTTTPPKPINAASTSDDILDSFCRMAELRSARLWRVDSQATGLRQNSF